MDLPNVDEKATIKNARKKLSEYHMWREYAHDSAEQKITANYTFEPRTKTNEINRAVEDIAVNKVTAEQELEAIEKAVNGILNPIHRQILVEKFLKPFPMSNTRLGIEVGYASTALITHTNKALFAFAQRYRGGELIKEV